MKRALLSVSDKNGIVDFGRALVERGWELLSTGGTARTLRDAGLPVTNVSDVTRHPEMLDGRVKTLHPAIHAGLLARRSRPDDLEALETHGYAPIDLVAVNLYPFRETVARGGVSVAEAMEQVDIGGPTMIRAAAKSHADVLVVVDPTDYPDVLALMDARGSSTPEGGAPAADETPLRRRLATKVFRHISAYDAAVADFLEAAAAQDGDHAYDPVPARLDLSFERVQTLRYGENPDQEAAFYAPTGHRTGVSALQQHHGKELSYNNLLDLDGALLGLAPFALSPRAAVCIIKHTTPCGLGVADDLADAYRKALATDPTSAFGSVIAVNREVDTETAELMSELFIECVVAPGYDREAMARLTEKKNIRVLNFPELEGEVPGFVEEAWEGDPDALRQVAFLAVHGAVPDPRVLRSVYGGLLVQTPPVPPFYGLADHDWNVVTERAPTEQEQDDLAFAWAAIFGVKSNAILLAKDGAVLGIGAGQMSRVDSSKIAVMKAAEAGHALKGAVLASDAFFPFRDGVDAAAAAGIRAVIQPGGSVRDQEVIDAANEHGIAMVFTGRRLFRH